MINVSQVLCTVISCSGIKLYKEFYHYSCLQQDQNNWQMFIYIFLIFDKFHELNNLTLKFNMSLGIKIKAHAVKLVRIKPPQTRPLTCAPQSNYIALLALRVTAPFNVDLSLLRLSVVQLWHYDWERGRRRVRERGMPHHQISHW